MNLKLCLLNVKHNYAQMPKILKKSVNMAITQDCHSERSEESEHLKIALKILHFASLHLECRGPALFQWFPNTPFLNSFANDYYEGLYEYWYLLELLIMIL